MKKILLVLCFLLNSQLSYGQRNETFTFGDGGSTSGGGGSYLVKAVIFPDQDLLSEAVLILSERVSRSPYPQEFKNDFVQELEDLYRQKRFYLVEEVTSFGYDRFKGDYPLEQKDGSLYLHAVKTFTTFEIGAPIFFESTAAEGSADKLAQLIAEEIPHHILDRPESLDEVFVKELGYSIMNGVGRENFSEALSSWVSGQDSSKNLSDHLSSQGFSVPRNFSFDSIRDLGVLKALNLISLEDLSKGSYPDPQDLLETIAYNRDYATEVLIWHDLNDEMNVFRKTDIRIIERYRNALKNRYGLSLEKNAFEEVSSVSIDEVSGELDILSALENEKLKIAIRCFQSDIDCPKSSKELQKIYILLREYLSNVIRSRKSTADKIARAKLLRDKLDSWFIVKSEKYVNNKVVKRDHRYLTIEEAAKYNSMYGSKRGGVITPEERAGFYRLTVYE